MKTLLLFALLLGAVTLPARAQSSRFVLTDVIFSAGALVGESPSFRVDGTLGQPFVGRAASSKYVVTLGFWAAASPEPPAPTAIETVDADAVPSQFALDQNYPNPFNPATRIRYALPSSAQVRLAIYDVLGREVAVLVDRRHAPGTYEVTFEAGDLPSGLYFYRLETGRFSEIRQMLLVK